MQPVASKVSTGVRVKAALAATAEATLLLAAFVGLLWAIEFVSNAWLHWSIPGAVYLCAYFIGFLLLIGVLSMRMEHYAKKWSAKLQQNSE